MPTLQSSHTAPRAVLESSHAARIRTAVLLVLSVGLLMGAGGGRKRGKMLGDGPPSAPQNLQAGVARPRPLSKSMAVQSVIGALGVSGNPASEKTLERIVTGEIDFGGHGKEAAQYVLLGFIMQPKPQSDEFLVRVLTEPDERIRPGDKGVYPASTLRSDAAHALAKAANPRLRLALAKAYSQPGLLPASRTAIEEILSTDTPANLAAQIELLQSAETPEPVKKQIEKILLARNPSAVKQALKLEPIAEPGPAAAASPFGGAAGGAPGATGVGSSILAGLGKVFGLGGSPPAGGRGGAAPAAAAAVSTNPAAGAASAVPAAPAGGLLARASLNRKPGLGAKPGIGMGPSATEVQAANKPNAGPAGAASAQNPAIAMLDMVAQAMSAQRVDAATVAGIVWKPEFIDSLAKQLADAKLDKSELAGTLASIPKRSARTSLKEYLQSHWSDGPKDFAKLAATNGAPQKLPGANTPVAAAPAARGLLGRGKGRRANMNEPSDGQAGMHLPGQAGSVEHEHVTEFGEDWLDPGALLVLKTSGQYAERPKEKPKRPGYNSTYNTMGYGGRVNPVAARKRAERLAEKHRLLEASYEWREAIEHLVRHWDERLNAAAVETAEDADAADKPSADKPSADKAPKAGAKSSPVSDDAPAIKASPPAAIPKPSTPMPIALHAGGKITKEFHLRWPEDLPGRLSSVVSDPLVVHYVRLEAPGEFTKTLVHYRSAITAVASTKTTSAVREIEDGKWIDAVQKDQAAQRARAFDVFITRQPADDDKKSKVEPLTVEILMVETEMFDPEKEKGSSSTKKEGHAASNGMSSSKRTAKN